jgi:hypothetical protein
MLGDFTGEESPGYLAFLAPSVKERRKEFSSAAIAERGRDTVAQFPSDTISPEITLFSPKAVRGILVVPGKETTVIGLAKDESEIITVLVDDIDARLKTCRGALVSERMCPKTRGIVSLWSERSTGAETSAQRQ